jgi:hypothetical protein
MATGPTVTVNCWSDDDWRDVRDELAVLDGRHQRLPSLVAAAGVWLGAVHLAPTTCAALEPLLEEKPDEESRSAVSALVVLGHEAAHAAGTEDEVAAECHSVQLVRPIARSLGTDAAGAATLARDAWRLYRARSLRRALWSPQCKDGGPLDLNLGNGWP